MRSFITPESLPTPQLVAVPTFEALFQAKRDLFLSLAPDYAYLLASDPAVKVLRVLALSDLFLYGLANDRALATTLSHAKGNDLDAVGQFYGIVRAVVQEEDNTTSPPTPEVMESDERYRERIADGVIAFSAAGPAEHYRFHAMSSDTRVKDALVYSPDLPNFVNMGGRVSIVILSTEDNGVPSLDLLSVVRTAVLAKDKKVTSDIVNVEPAVIRPIDVVMDIVLERNASPDILIALEEELRTKFTAQQRLGWDAPRSWFTRVLSPEGVYESTLVSPDQTFVVRPNQFPHLNSVQLRFAGIVQENDWDSDELAEERLMREVHEKYISYAVATKRTRVQIQNDLTLEMKEGIVMPTLSGVADYLGLTNIRVGGVLIPADEIAISIHYTLSKYYERGFYQPGN